MKCSLCNASGVTKLTCPRNPNAKNVNYAKHKKTAKKSKKQQGGSKKQQGGSKPAELTEQQAMQLLRNYYQSKLIKIN